MTPSLPSSPAPGTAKRAKASLISDSSSAVMSFSFASFDRRLAAGFEVDAAAACLRLGGWRACQHQHVQSRESKRRTIANLLRPHCHCGACEIGRDGSETMDVKENLRPQRQDTAPTSLRRQKLFLAACPPSSCLTSSYQGRQRPSGRHSSRSDYLTRDVCTRSSPRLCPCPAAWHPSHLPFTKCKEKARVLYHQRPG